MIGNKTDFESFYQQNHTKISEILMSSTDRTDAFSRLVELGLSEEYAVHIIQNFFEQELYH